MNKMATFEDIRKNQHNLIMDIDFTQFTELIDIQPCAECHFIHSMSEPFSEEDIQDTVMHNWLNHFHMRFHQLHASGHMSKPELIDMVNTIQPKHAYAVHTENQKLFKTHCNNIQPIQQAKPIQLK